MRNKLFCLLFCLMAFSATFAQQIKNGSKYWDGSVLYVAQVYSNGSVDLNGQDINGDSYNITLMWLSEKGEYDVFSRNGAIALRIEESAQVKLIYRDRVGHFLAFYNSKGDAAWTMEFFINADMQGLTAMERRLEQQPPSEVITSTPLNTTWLARFSKSELRLMRNEILARHGWNFQSKDLQEHFGKQSWYKPAKSNSSIKVSDLELANLQMIKSEETTPDEYRNSMLSADMFPGGLADDGRGPDEVDDIKSFTVTNEREFLNALGSDRTIVIAKNVHLNLSRVLENENLFSDNPARRWGDNGEDFIGQMPLVVSQSETDGQQLDLVNIKNLTIRGAGNSSIEVFPRYSYCIYFINCENCRIENLTIGHSEGGECSGGVIGVEQGSRIFVFNCDLYGCGTYGFDIRGCYWVDVRNCRIHHCTYGIMQLNSCQSVDFTNCDFYQNKEFQLVDSDNSIEVSFSDCRFYDNSESILFKFDTQFSLQGCEIYHPSNLLGAVNKAEQTGKKNSFQPPTSASLVKPRAIGPDL